MGTGNWTYIKPYEKAVEDGEAIAIIWTGDDVRQQALDRRIIITDEQVRDVLSLMDSKHDATIGISWDTIDAWIDYVLDNAA